MRGECLVILVLLVGCGSEMPTASSERARQAADRTAVLAIVDGTPVRWSELAPAMMASAGGEALAEWVLDRELARTCARLNKTPGDRAVAAEKQQLLEELSTDPDTAARLLNRLRQTRGLDDQRFEQLLRRNAALRGLVAEQVTVTEAMAREAHRRESAEQTEVRLILVADLRGAEKVLQALKQGGDFIDLAVTESLDSSRAQGGLLPPVAPHDPTYPKAIRDTAAALEPGRVSEPIAVEGGFALLRCERKITPEKVPFEEASERLRRVLRLQQERALMRQRAQVLLRQADVTVLEPVLDRSWQRQRDQVLQTP